MNKLAKTAFAVAIAALAVVPKAHATTKEVSAVIADCIATHGSIVCNPAWLDRPGSYAILDMARSVRMDKKVKEILLRRGMTDFDNSVRQLGKAGACQKLNSVLVDMGG
jgi:hypothetical protein